LSMSNPRQIIPGSTYLVTRRTSGRKYLLKPTPIVKQVFLYCLAHAASIYNIQIHAYCVMSNHYHMVITDPEGRMPAFMSWLNEFIAKTLNCVWQRSENLWASKPYSAQRLETLDDVVDKMVYTLTNPVKAFLVSRAERWPGATSRAQAFERSLAITRPPLFFRNPGPMPERVALNLVVPKGFEGGDDEFKTQLNKLVQERESSFVQEARQLNRGFLGSSAARTVQHEDFPEGASEKYCLDPHVASKNGLALRNALSRLKWFRAEYAAARARFDKGETDVEFPFGTYGLKNIVKIQAIPPPELCAYF